MNGMFKSNFFKANIYSGNLSQIPVYLLLLVYFLSLGLSRAQFAPAPTVSYGSLLKAPVNSSLVEYLGSINGNTYAERWKGKAPSSENKSIQMFNATGEPVQEMPLAFSVDGIPVNCQFFCSYGWASGYYRFYF